MCRSIIMAPRTRKSWVKNFATSAAIRTGRSFDEFYKKAYMVKKLLGKRKQPIQTSTRKRFRGQGSQVKYLRKNKKKFSEGGHDAHGSKSFAKLIYRPTKIGKYYNALSNLMIDEKLTFSAIVTGAGGLVNFQKVQHLDSQFQGNTDVLNILQSGFTNLPLANPLNNVNLAPTLAGQKAMKIYFDSVFCEYEFVNQTVAHTTMWIYNVVSKVTKPLYVTPNTDWETGIDDMQGSGSTTTLYPGAKPNISKFFNINWKIVKVNKVVLGPGQVHRHTWMFKPRNICDYEYFSNNNQVRGMTTATFVICKGQPTDDTQTFATPANVNLSPIKIIFTLKKQYRWKFLGLLPSNYKQTNNLDVAKIQAPGQEITINDESGTIANSGDPASVG